MPRYPRTLANIFSVKSDWYQQQQISELEDSTSTMAAQFARINAQVADQAARIDALSATVAVMAEMLAGANQLDLTVLDERIANELGALADARRTPQTKATVTCSLCHFEVPPARTAMTANGAICDPSCAANR